jgi:hypothetical protein
VRKPEIETLLESIAKYLPQAKAAARSNRNSKGYQGDSTYQKATRDYSSERGIAKCTSSYFREA